MSDQDNPHLGVCLADELSGKDDEIARLTAERDEARNAIDKWCNLPRGYALLERSRTLLEAAKDYAGRGHDRECYDNPCSCGLLDMLTAIAAVEGGE